MKNIKDSGEWILLWVEWSPFKSQWR